MTTDATLTVRDSGDHVELRVDDQPVITLDAAAARWLLATLERRVERQ